MKNVLLVFLLYTLSLICLAGTISYLVDGRPLIAGACFLGGILYLVGAHMTLGRLPLKNWDSRDDH